MGFAGCGGGSVSHGVLVIGGDLGNEGEVRRVLTFAVVLSMRVA